MANRIDEAALLGYCFKRLHQRGIYIETAADDEFLGSVHAAIVALLNVEARSGRSVDRIEREAPVSEVAGLKFIVGRKREGGQTVRLYTFGLKDAGAETSLPLLGIALTVFTAIPNWGLVPQAGGIAKALWSKLVVLQRPEDNDAIDALEALVAIRAKNYADGDPSSPSSTDLMEDLGWELARLASALSGLNAKKIIEPEEWGGQRDDYSHPDTRWRVKL